MGFISGWACWERAWGRLMIDSDIHEKCIPPTLVAHQQQSGNNNKKIVCLKVSFVTRTALLWILCSLFRIHYKACKWMCNERQWTRNGALSSRALLMNEFQCKPSNLHSSPSTHYMYREWSFISRLAAMNYSLLLSGHASCGTTLCKEDMRAIG